MSKLKFVSIDSFQREDTNDLFEAMCKHILKKPSLDVKKNVLKLDGSKKELEEYKADISDLINIITQYDIKFEFKLTYLDDTIIAEEKPLMVKEPALNATGKAMAEQNKAVTNDELKPGMDSAPGSPESKKEITGDQLPKGPDFLEA